MSADLSHLFRPSGGSGRQFEVTPATAGWQYLSFSVVSLAAGDSFGHRLDDQETAIVPLSGSGAFAAGGESFVLTRQSVFTQIPEVLYAPPGVEITVTTESNVEFAIGSAPAEGKYPLRLFTPADMKTEVRGGGAAHRQISHVLSPPLPAERLILYEVYVPRGTWSGWAPHCHDGYDGSPYLEETYYFRLDPGDGFAMHRNWRVDEPFDEVLLAHDGDCALVTKGYHSSVACPGSNMFFLNFLAGELYDDERTTPPCFHSSYTWIDEAWENDDAGAWQLPVVSK